MLRKVYYSNALPYLPAVRASIEKQFAALDLGSVAPWMESYPLASMGPGGVDTLHVEMEAHKLAYQDLVQLRRRSQSGPGAGERHGG